MTNILLLRSPSDGDGGDLYTEIFAAYGYNPISVPVLETVLCNLDLLQHLRGFSGIIMTSSRACQVAWRDVPRDIPIYVVGKSTRSTLLNIDPSTPKDIRGDDSGTAEQLAHFILQDQITRPCKMLYLTGDKNRDILPNILKEGGIELCSIQVYATQGSQTFPRDLSKALEEASVCSEWWTIFFAPSSSEFTLPILKQHFRFRGVETLALSLPETKVATIGPTTERFLRETLHIHVDVTPSKPTPTHLLEAIQQYTVGKSKLEPLSG